MHSGPVIIGFDGTRAAQHALNETAPLLAAQEVLVVVVWEAGRAFDLADLPSLTLDNPAASLDLRAAFEADRAAYEAALRLAEQGAQLATDAGLKAEGLAVADELSVADTLVRLATEQDARAVVVGGHGHNPLAELLLGHTAHEVLDKAPCPVVVVREHAERG
ncbi:universal stress protein [Actinophytocola sp.]|jgi:nucleotide-binding universal stress UspA family protein|uniref:universal stress protein n=1 Tax=Actinophytocola sp. TaxID=1872138 RepID=UPI002EDACD8F